MVRLRRTFIALVVTLALSYYIERFEIGKSPFQNMPYIVFFIQVSIVVLTTSIPLLRKSAVNLLFAFWGAIYVLVRFLFAREAAFFGGISTFVLISDVTLLLLTVYISRDFACGLDDFELAVEEFFFGDVKQRIPRLDLAKEDVQIEMSRSYRYRHPLSVVVVEVDPDLVDISLNRVIEEVQETMMDRYASLCLGRIIKKNARLTDMVIERDARGSFIVLCTDTDTEGARVLVNRIRTDVLESLRLPVRAGIASFPDSANTFNDLVLYAEEQMRTPYGQHEQSR
ncbi:MAG: hypothetical protein HC876_19025 [Chloroflexaceae bacterium]|nr:hypothetical protein [Chloroflexaceae bacterium]